MSMPEGMKKAILEVATHAMFDAGRVEGALNGVLQATAADDHIKAALCSARLLGDIQSLTNLSWLLDSILQRGDYSAAWSGEAAAQTVEEE